MDPLIKTLFTPFLFWLGAAMGSFLGVVADRTTFGKSIGGRSHCDYCGKTLSPWVLVPIFSYLFFRGNSSCCHKPLSWTYPVLELLSGIAFLVLWTYSPFNVLSTVILLVVLSCAIVLVVSDLKYQLIADEVQYVLFFAILLFQGSLHGCSFLTMFDAFRSGILTCLPILALYVGTQGRGMGFADVKLAVNIGALLGIPLGFIGLYMSFMLGAVYGVIVLLFRQKGMKSEIPFGPFLVGGTIISALYAPQFLLWWHRMFYFLT